MKNLKNKSAVILSPEAGVKISGASVESVVNDRAKTKRYSAKRDLYARSPDGSRLKMTEKVLSFLRLRGASGAQGISATASCRKAHKRRFIFNPWILRFAFTPLRMTIPVLALLFSLNLSTSWAKDSCTCSWGGADNKTLTITNCPNGELSSSSCTNQRKAKNVIVGTGVTSIGYNAFSGVYFTSITIPEGVTSIGNYAFYGTVMTNITIPDSITSIGNHAFEDTIFLTSITIPDSVTSIGAMAFQSARSLTSITIPDNINTAQWSNSAFNGLSESANIVCQGGLNTCYEKLAKYFTKDDPNCPANVTCNCSRYCISPSRISEATQNQCGGKYTWDETSNPKCRHMTDNECANSAQYYINNGQCKSMPGSKTTCKNADLLWSGSSCVKSCASGFVEWDNECLSEYPFAKKRWTPAEANEWLHDGNDNFVVITFKK